jgi:hypothetical protein
MPDDTSGFKVSSAYVTVAAETDETSAKEAGKLLGEIAEQAAGQVKIKADVDETSAEGAGKLLADVAREAAGDVTVKAEGDVPSGTKAGEILATAVSAGAGKITIPAGVDADQVKTSAAKAAVAARAQISYDASIDRAKVGIAAAQAAAAAKAKIVYDDAIDKAKVLEDADRAAAEAEAKITYDAAIDKADVAAKAKLAATEARAKITYDASINSADVTAKAKLAGTLVGDAASTATKEAESSSGAGSWLPILITAGITAGLPLVAGAASILGVAAIGAVGVAMQRKNPSIDAAWQDLVSTFQAGATEASGVIDGPIVDALGSLTTVVTNAEPELDSMFQGVSADIPVFASGLERLIQGALPGFNQMVSASRPIVQGFSTVLGDIGQGVGSIASTIAHDSPEIGQDLASFGQVAKNSAVAIGGLVDIAAKLGVVVGPVLEGLTTAIGSVTTGFETNSSVLSVAEHSNDLAAGKFLNVKAALDAERAAADNASDSITKYTNGLQLETVSAGFTGPAETIAEGLAKIGDKASDDKAKVQGLSDVLEALVNPGGAAISTLAGISTTEQGLADQLKGLKGPLVDQAGNFDLNSKRGAAAATAIEGLAGNYTQYITQAEQAKVPTDQINANLQTQYDNLVKTAEGFGVTKDKVGAYLASLGIVPPGVQTAITTPGMEQAISDVINLHGQIVGVPTDHTVTTTALTADAIQHLKDLGYTVTTLPNGNVTVSANTGPAAASLNDLITTYDHATITIHTAVTGGGSLSSMLHGAGAIIPAFHAPGDIVPMANAAQIVPPGQLRSPDGGLNVVGDRHDVPEAYIPLDSSARSRELAAYAAAATGAGGAGSVSNHYGPITVMTSDPVAAAQQMLAEFQWLGVLGRN